MAADKPTDDNQFGRNASTAVSIEPEQPPCLQKERDAFTPLPDKVVTVILGLLDWQGRINMESAYPRLKAMVNDGPWARSARFTLNDLPTAFTTVTSQPRSEAITELDVSNYVLANSDRLAAGIGRCQNLIVLRCVHCRLQPATLFQLVRYNLPRLECLYWSVLEEPMDGFPAHPDAAPGPSKRDGKCAIVPATLTRMYVEAINEPASVAFVENAVKHCRSLRSLHFHERGGSSPVSGVARRILYAFRSGTLDDFDEMTYTSEYAPSYAFPPAYPLPLQRNLFRDFGRYVEVYKNVTLKARPERSCSCVILNELQLTSSIVFRKQLTVLIAESGEETISRLVKATCRGTCRHIEALTLMSLPEAGKMFWSKNVRNQAALCNFIRSCIALTELNLSAFHFSEDFDCCSVIATGGLDNLRALAMVPCALCNPRRLELLSRASFKLRELDIRSGLGRAGCKVCQLKTTCDDVSLAALCRLRHLTRLTLCELEHARSLNFLDGCESLVDLRLRNMGMWQVGCRQDMSPIAVLWTQLHTLKLESVYNTIDFTFINNVPVAPKLLRLCLATVIKKDCVEELLPSKLKLICPAANVIHLHALYLEVELENDMFVLSTLFKQGDKIERNIDELFVSSADKAWLCTCLNTVGSPKQYGIN